MRDWQFRRRKRERARETLEYRPPTPYYATLYEPILPQAQVAAQTASPVRLVSRKWCPGTVYYHRSIARGAN